VRRGRYPVKAAAFDTRMHGPTALTGRASKRADRLLRADGSDVVAEPESFLVTRQDRLDSQETGRARDWAARLAASIAPRVDSRKTLTVTFGPNRVHENLAGSGV